jgi:hypothetical protein
MKNLLILFIFFYSIIATAQSVAINNDGTTAVASAVLDLKSTTKGFLPPRMTIAERDLIESPATGLLIWCTDCGTTGAINIYNGTIWENITAVADDGPVIAITSGTDTVEHGSTWTDAGATADGGETVNATCIVDTNFAGTYRVVYSAIDASGNVGTAIRTVTVNVPGLSIGDIHEGGFVFWLDPADNTHGKVCALEDAPTTLDWYGATTYSNGYTNSDTGTGVYSNWYLPSKDELQLMYANLQRFGCNTNTPGSDDVTTCETRKGDFLYDFYWSSSEFVDGFAWRQFFMFGLQTSYTIYATANVRAVRAF